MEEINNTPNNVSETNKWLTDLEMDVDEYNLFPEECNMNFFDANEEEFLSHDMAIVFHEEQTQQQSLTSESTSTTLSNNSINNETSFESFDFDFEIKRPTKHLKTIDQSEIINETFSPNLSPSSSNSSIQSLILSFDDPNSPSNNTPQIYGFDPTLNSKQNDVVSVPQPQLGNMNLSTQIPKGSPKNQNMETKTSEIKRSRAQAKDHIMAERKRRENISKSFIALAALVPGLKKMDKATVLSDAIKYVKELKERIDVLEEQNKKTEADSMVVITKQDICNDDDYSSSDESIDGATESLLQVEAKVSGKEMLIRIHCKKYKGILVKIIAEIQNFKLFLVKSSVLAFGDSVLDITIIAQMGDGYNLTTKELVKKLRMAALKFISS